VRDAALDETLRRLATEAAGRFRNLVAGGDEIPFDVAEADGDHALFYRYVPLTRRYVVDRSDEILGLPSFGAACSAVATAEVAAPYLEARGLPVPADPRQRAAGMLVAFLSELWDGCSEFTVNRAQLDGALAALQSESRSLEASDVLIAPIAGLKTSAAPLDLPNGVRIVPADAIEAPLEAMSSEGMDRRPWEPQMLALAEVGEEDGDRGSALAQLHDLISVLRLFKAGGVALGPYAFAPTGEGKWRRIATGAPATRPGGYRLSETESAELVRLAELLAERPDPEGALAWAVRRFELGCERPTAFEGLSDHLLALRALLEGEGTVGAGLEVRAAALIAENADRDEVASRLREGAELERSLILGPVDDDAALELASWLEECVRALLRDAALGELGRDLGAAADESLIATGLQAGDARGAEADEWDVFVEEEVGEFTVTPSEGETAARGHESEDTADDSVTGLLEPIPADTSEIRVTWAGAEEEDEPSDDEVDWGFAEDQPEEDEMTERDWLSEVSREDRATLEWPAAGEAPRRLDPDREPIDTPRVRHLFPVPDDADWEVRELRYDRRRAGLGR
jgi:hypothetical protein